ncbi:MAG: DUF554 domain-containing protein [Peptococcaceae bacterium]|jgi:uncharacterized membrane protein YqgA involved in biofilm formation|nr:DUF554 domain-containing protein [Peptococcaceae bacterium]
MIGIGTIVNVLLILIGGALGLFLKKILSQRLTDTILQGIGLAVVLIGLSGALKAAFTVVDGEISANYTLLMILSLALGALIGEWLDIEKRLENFAAFWAGKFTKSDSGLFAQGFVTATLVFCVGAMAIVGALEDGIHRNTDILFAKSMLDAIAAMVFASTMGVGVLFSAVSVAVYQGAMTLLASLIAPYLQPEVITQMSYIGSILILAIGLNMLKIAKIKVGNLLLAIFVPLVYYIVKSLFSLAGM